MPYKQIITSRQSRVETITLNRPHRLNAWTEQMRAELCHAIEACNEDADVGAIVLTGAGRGFCSGADIGREFGSRLEGAANRDDREHQPVADWVTLLRASKPIIAAVNGVSIGVGLTMILPCDVILASTDARFGMVFVRMGVVPELASSHFAVARMGLGRASEMCLTGRLYSAEEAFEYRLADHLLAPGKLMPKAIELASEIAANPAPQLRWTKELLTLNASETDLDKVRTREMERLMRAYESPEHAEAVARFLRGARS